jgi:hypothetical protein
MDREPDPVLTRGEAVAILLLMAVVAAVLVLACTR